GVGCAFAVGQVRRVSWSGESNAVPRWLDTPSRAAISGCTPSRPAVEDWVAELERGRFDAAWDLFLDRYRRLIFAAIRHYAQDYDDVMDVFARACEALRADDLRRLRSWSSSRAANTTLGRCRMRARSLILLPLLLVACERQPAAPDRALRPEFAAIHSEITDFFEEVDGPADCTANPKIGEIVLFTGRINYVLRATTTPSGKVDTTLK